MGKSYGVWAAKMAGMPENVVVKARLFSKLLTKEKENVMAEMKLMKSFNGCIKALVKVENEKTKSVEEDIKALDQILSKFLS